MLKTFAFDFHRRQHQAIADEVGRVADAFGRFEAASMRWDLVLLMLLVSWLFAMAVAVTV